MGKAGRVHDAILGVSDKTRGHGASRLCHATLAVV